MSGLSSLSRTLYRASRAAGDLNALQRGGPERLAKRVVRRTWHRTVLRNVPGWRWPR